MGKLIKANGVYIIQSVCHQVQKNQPIYIKLFQQEIELTNKAVIYLDNKKGIYLETKMLVNNKIIWS